jgi:hypothetical protein
VQVPAVIGTTDPSTAALIALCNALVILPEQVTASDGKLEKAKR